jgi:hypothetical protein
MAGHWTDLYSFVGGAIRQTDLGYLVLSNDDAAEKKIPMAGIVQWEPEGWADGGTVNWRAAGVAVVRKPLEQLCVVGEFGEVLMLGSGDRHDERIGKGKNSPGERGPLRGVRTIGEHVYCVGMDRQAYRRDAARKWTPITQGLPPAEDDDVAGLEAIDGFSETEIYAAGWDGEIWQFDGQAWLQRDSPVNTVLVDICCAEDGWVYGCGRNGVLVRGRNEDWSVLDLGGFSDDLWSLASYSGRLYVATMEYVLLISDKGLEVVDMGRDRPKTCYKLAAAQGLLWSIGAKDVMQFDGTTWTRID